MESKPNWLFLSNMLAIFKGKKKIFFFQIFKQFHCNFRFYFHSEFIQIQIENKEIGIEEKISLINVFVYKNLTGGHTYQLKKKKKIIKI